MKLWCKDCKHDYKFNDWQLEYCDACLINSIPRMKPIGYEQIEPEEPDESEAIDDVLFILNRIWICGGIKNYSDYCELHDAIKAMDNSVRKTGKWFDVGSLSCRCSECGCKSPKEFRYCPNCGAKMGVEE